MDYDYESENEQFEKEWRELLMKRLSTVQSVLKRDAAAECKKSVEARELAAGYATVEEAHNAYGYDEITWGQYERIRATLEADPNIGNVAHAALKNINEYISSLKSDIIEFNASREHDAKIKNYFADLKEKKEWEDEQNKN